MIQRVGFFMIWDDNYAVSVLLETFSQNFEFEKKCYDTEKFSF